MTKKKPAEEPVEAPKSGKVKTNPAPKNKELVRKTDSDGKSYFVYE